MLNIIHENIIKYRKLSNLTKVEAADLAQINHSTYNSYEAGERVPSIVKLNALAEVFNIPLPYLLYDESDRIKCHEFQEKYFVKACDKFAFAKGNTHLVLKREDIINSLSLADRRALERIVDVIAEERRKIGKTPCPDYIICNQDEPYMQYVLSAILAGELEKNK